MISPLSLIEHSFDHTTTGIIKSSTRYRNGSCDGTARGKTRRTGASKTGFGVNRCRPQQRKYASFPSDPIPPRAADNNYILSPASKRVYPLPAFTAGHVRSRRTPFSFRRSFGGGWGTAHPQSPKKGDGSDNGSIYFFSESFIDI